MPGAKAKGFLAYRAITSVPIMAANAVAVNTLPPGISGKALKMLGFTAKI